MRTITGIVAQVSISPGSGAQVVIDLERDGSGTSPTNYYLNVGPTGTTWGGGETNKDVTLLELFEKLIASKYPVQVTLYPDAERYGASTRADFVQL